MSYGMANSQGLVGPTGKVGNKIPKGYKAGQLQQFTPEQVKLFQSLFSQVSPDSFTARLAGGDQSAFGQLEAPALRQFSAIQGNLASRYSAGGGGQGALSARHSSGFQNESTAAATNFAEQLQGQRLGYQQQALKDLMAMSRELLGYSPYKSFLTKKNKSQGFDFGGLVGGALGGIGGFFTGGPAGAVAGAGLGYNALGRGGSGTSNQDISDFASTFMK